MTSERVRLTAAEAHTLARQALVGGGCDDDEARVLADHMLDAALCGYEYSGLPKVLNVVEYRRRHPPRAPMCVRRETPSSTSFDGGGHNGMLTLMRATEAAIAKARTAGFALVGVNNTWMSGRSAYYVEHIARAGLIGIHTVSARHLVAPPGAAKAAIGTNPIAFGFPTEHEPLVIDVGLSALMVTDLALRARRSEALPEGVAIDGEGQPTRDPVAALAGAVLPFGGYKGFALALAMQALGILAGSADDPDHAGYVIIAVEPSLMMPLAEYRRELSRSLATLKAAPRQPGVSEIRLPSERAFAERERNRRDGIVIDRTIHADLVRLSDAAPLLQAPPRPHSR